MDGQAKKQGIFSHFLDGIVNTVNAKMKNVHLPEVETEVKLDKTVFMLVFGAIAVVAFLIINNKKRR